MPDGQRGPRGYRGQKGERGNGLTRRELEAIVWPILEDVQEIKKDTKEVEALVNSALNQWHTSNATFLTHLNKLDGKFVEEVNKLDKKIIFAQGATAATSFLVGSGVVMGIAYLVLRT